MEMFEIFICILIIIGLILILSGKARTMLKGFWGLFFTNLAKTPEGAEAIYQEAIEQAQNDYNEASDTLNTLAGKLETSKTNLQRSQEELKNVQDKCEQLAKAGKFDQLDTYSVRLDEVTADVELEAHPVSRRTPARINATILLILHHLHCSYHPLQEAFLRLSWLLFLLFFLLKLYLHTQPRLQLLQE